MKYNKILLTLFSLSFILLNSCKKFLDVEPKGYAIIKTIDQYNGLFNNSPLITYANFSISSGGAAGITGYADLPVIMADDVFSAPANLTTLPLLSYANAFKWQPDIYLPTDDAPDWGAFYAQNYIYNVIVNGVMDAEDGTLEQKKQLLSEARANRALVHFMVANFFGKPYNATTANTDLSVPIVTEANVGQTGFRRATVKELYDFVVSELQAAIPDLPLQTTSRVRLAQAGGYFILGQVYLFMADYNNALVNLNNSRTSLTTSAIPVSLYDYNTTMATWYNAATPHRGASLHPQQFNSNEVFYTKQQLISTYYTRNAAYIKPSVMNLFNPTDHRLKFFFNKDYVTGATMLAGFQRNSPGAVNWGPSLPNLYLMLAECKARLNDLTGAKQELETLRTKRMPLVNAAVPLTTQEDMVKFVLAERQREYAGTGVRWFDMRRLSTDPVYNNIDPTHQLGTENYTLTNARLTMRIPPKVLDFNPGMPDNQ